MSETLGFGVPVSSDPKNAGQSLPLACEIELACMKEKAPDKKRAPGAPFLFACFCVPSIL